MANGLFVGGVGLVLTAGLLTALPVARLDPPDDRRKEVLAEQFTAYHHGVVDYAVENPGFTGEADIADIDVPPGFGWGNVTFGNEISNVSGGDRVDIVVYAELPDGASWRVAEQFRSLREAPQQVGVAGGTFSSGGTTLRRWRSPRQDPLPSGVPTTVPEGAIVSRVQANR